MNCAVFGVVVDNSGTSKSFGIPQFIPCPRPAEFHLKGAVGVPGGTCFVCKEHEETFQYRVKTSLDDWYIQQAESDLEG